MSFAEIESALVALEARGARAFDGDGCDFVRTLLARGEALPPPAGALVLQRARVHLARLGERFDRVLERTQTQLESAEQIHGPLEEQRAALERRELRALRRDLRRIARSRRPHRARPRLRHEDEQRSANEYEAAMLELSAQYTVARAVEDVPVHAGPYNALRIATDLLARIGAVSPSYLAAQLRRLDELAIMLTLPAPPRAPEAAPPPKKPRARPKRRARGG